VAGIDIVHNLSNDFYKNDRGSSLPRAAMHFHLHFKSDAGSVSEVSGKAKSKRRSGCPVSISLEVLGDRWSLLIVRDLMVRGFRTFKEFEKSGEGIATNILADRLQSLKAMGIIIAEATETDRRRVNYRLTEKGIDLAPVLLELLIWGARHEETGAPRAVISQMEQNREQVLAEVRRRWRERDPTPLLPRFENAGNQRNFARARTERVRPVAATREKRYEAQERKKG
jgi:DNA-binding HxlR family transcriptional regulator